MLARMGNSQTVQVKHPSPPRRFILMPALSDGGSGRAGPFYLQMAEFDIVTGQSKYEDTVQKFLAFTQSTGANFSDEKYVAE
jgi:hypothetical protein